MTTSKTVTREKLYAEVWQTPGRKLAERYGVSDVAVAKICRKMDVPRPYRGYWSRIQSGQQPKKTPLPRAKTDTILVHEFTRRGRKPTSPGGRPPKEKRPEFQDSIVVPSRLGKLHPLLEVSREELKRAENNHYWDPLSYMRRHVSIIVHRRAQGRAFRIMNAFIKAIEARGHEVAISDCYYGGGCAIIFGQKIRFDMRDRDCALPGDDAPGAVPFAWSWEKGPAKVRRGLVFRVYKSWNNGCGTSHWRDGKKQRLEDLLDLILLQMAQLARSDRRCQIRDEKQRQKDEEQERVRRAREAELAAEEQRREALVRAADAWKRIGLLRNFIEAMAEQLDTVSGEADGALEWARQVADEMDPLKGGKDDLLKRIGKSGHTK